MRPFVLLLVGGILFAQSPANAPKAAAHAAAAKAPAEAAFHPVGSSLQIMKAMVIPSSNALFEVGGKEPKNDAEWQAVQNQAIVLAEAANLLMMPGRAVDNGNWMKFSKQMQDAAIAGLKAAEAKNVDKLVDEVGDQILQSCSACHDQYMKK